MKKTPSIASRKARHIQAVLSGQAGSGRTNGLERFRFDHEAVPELDFTEVDSSAVFLGKTLSAPLLISPMTGGCEEAARINKNLARAAQARGVGMGVGSQRAALVHPDLRATFQVRKVAPDILLFANLGAVQLNNGMGVRECVEAVKMIEADALFLHLNPLQEVLQDGGDTNFSGLARKIRQVCKQAGVPVFVREVSSGISKRTAEILLDAGVSGIDVAGVGGTSWAKVEGILSKNVRTRVLSSLYADWGFDVAESLQNVRSVDRQIPLIASGGIRSGLEAAKCLGLGADLASIAAGFLQAAMRSHEAVMEEIDVLVEGIRVALFCSGYGSVSSLKGCFLEAPLLPERETRKVVPLRKEG